MNILRSLTNRIFLASAALAVLSIGAAVFFVGQIATRHAEAELQRGLLEAGALVDQQCANLVRSLMVTARLVANDPRLKAAVDTGDPPTVAPLAREYREQVSVALLVLTGRNGQLLAEAGDLEIAEEAIANSTEVREAMAGRESRGYWPLADGVLQVTTVPIAIGLDRPEIMGTLTVGSRLDNTLAQQFKRATESDIAFAIDGHVRAATLPSADRAQLASLLKADNVQTIALENGEYVAVKRPLFPIAPPAAGTAPRLAETAPTVLLLRSRTERLQFLNSIHTGLAVVAVVAVFAATILSYAVSRTITRPLATITGVMREMSATGDLTRKIAVSRAASWEDEDATLLATTFNTLTDSIARFQREAAQRERLSALGRLSTVIAHEIRNPLMIIKGSLRVLANERVSRDEIKQALTDVDEEVARLNRVVNDVLDFARPIRFDYAPADVNAVCAGAVDATRAEHGDVDVEIRLDRSLAPFETDAERLRTALVNVLANACHAVLALPAAAGARADRGAHVGVETARTPSGGVSITIRDRGAGVSQADLAQVFDPYFTTKRTGSGLGLAIAKNIVEGMGGSIALKSQVGEGSEIRIELPVRRAGLLDPPSTLDPPSRNPPRAKGAA